MRYAPATQSFRASATDLANHARCAYLTQRARERAVAIAEGREPVVEASGLIVEKGRAFETAYVARRRAETEAAGGRFIDIAAAAQGDPRAGRATLEAAMADGVELIAQAPLRSREVFGFADLLERVPGSEPAVYEPVEIKYARSVRVAHVLQACAYADALGALQDSLPERLHVVTGDGRRHTLSTHEHIEYYLAARERFGAAVALDLAGELKRVPDPVAHCVSCEFLPTCESQRRSVDHLGFVARIRADQRAKLAAVGITTLTQLAESTVDKVPNMGRATLDGLQHQARLQLAARELPLPGVEFRRPGSDEVGGRGFALLPPPDAEDMFFDFEGYPYHDSGALEYLWGWTTRAGDGSTTFDHLWADDPAAEARAFAAFLDEVDARRERSPGMHVFHYAPYEITALRRLAKQHPHEMWRLDRLLRAGVFVDLFAVVRQAMLVGTESYSIKQLEPLYGISRAGDDLADGGASIEVYEQWLLTSDPAVRETIIRYNRVDCDSTLALRDWLLEQANEAAAVGIAWPPRPVPVEVDEDEPSEDSTEEPVVTLAQRLERIGADPDAPGDVRDVALLLRGMRGWDRRIKREFFGDLYGRRDDRDAEDYVREPAAIGQLSPVERDDAPAGAKPGTIDRTYEFPDQVTLVEAKAVALDADTIEAVGTIREIDEDGRRVTIRTTAGERAKLVAKGLDPDRHPHSVIGWTHIRLDSLEGVARAVGEQFAGAVEAGRDPFTSVDPHAALLSILGRRIPAVTHGPGPETLATPPDPALLAELVQRMDGSHLVVQGPPGTGKTWTSARVIAALVAAGMRVGVAANSHAAIQNVLCGIEEAGAPGIRAAYALTSKEKERKQRDIEFGWLERSRSTKDAAAALRAGDVDVLAGTAWQFCQCETGELDVLLVDEAGQVSLLAITAMAACARRVLLVGDPQQLPQPSTVQHPFGLHSSVLEHLFEEHAVLPAERAVLLPVTRRMHPVVTDFISRTYYEGRLQSHPDTIEHRVAVDGLPSCGIHMVQVPHTGNRVSAPEEVAAITRLVAGMLEGGRVVARFGEPERPLQPDDIIVVAPYNAQRRELSAALPEGVRVGTVDRFQGQEAAVAITSLTASSRDDLPRGLEFLLDPHRCNVAVSRARALAIVVASPSLLATDAASLAELRLLNDVNAFRRRANPRD
ncbi:MAG: hypothetical protein JWM86_786 [Thermoleophilia bacterium]|nr:hypothetical protein [Thermoleophilia bacterium]